MTTTVAKVGLPVKNNGGTVLNGGNVVDTTVVALDLSNNASTTKNGSKVLVIANYTGKAISGGLFANKMTTGQYIIKGLTGQSIAGVALSGLGNLNTASERSGYDINRWSQYERLHITSWNYVTGAATLGGNAGDAAYFAAVDGTTVNATNKKTIDQGANPSRAIPGELVYMTTGVLPTQADYESK